MPAAAPVQTAPARLAAGAAVDDVGEDRGRLAGDRARDPDPVAALGAGVLAAAAEVDRQRPHPGLVADLRRGRGDQRRQLVAVGERQLVGASGSQWPESSSAQTIRPPIARASAVPGRRDPGERAERAERAPRPAAAGRSTRPCSGLARLRAPRADARSARRARGARRACRVCAAIERDTVATVAETATGRECRRRRAAAGASTCLRSRACCCDPDRPERPEGHRRLPLRRDRDAADHRPGGRGRARRPDRLGAAPRAPQPPRRARARAGQARVAPLAQVGQERQQGARPARAPGRASGAPEAGRTPNAGPPSGNGPWLCACRRPYVGAGGKAPGDRLVGSPRPAALRAAGGYLVLVHRAGR